MTIKETKPPEKKKVNKKNAGAFDNIAKHSTWNLLTGCFPPFGHPDNHDDQQSTTPDNKEDTHS